MADTARRIRRLAEHQLGLLSRTQATELGLDHWAVARRMASGELDEPRPGVLRIAGSPRTDAQLVAVELMAAGPDAAVSHTTAAWWWGVPGFGPRPVHVTRSRADTRARRNVHQTRVWPAHHRVRRDGLWVTSPARTVADLAGLVHPARAERAADRLWIDRHLSGEELANVLGELQGRGRRGIAVLRRLADERGPGYIPPESSLERRFHRLLDDWGEPPLERQVVIYDDEGEIGRVDALDRGRRIVVEIDSERHHTSIVDRRADAERDARLRRAGYEVVRITEEMLDAVLPALTAVRDARCRRDAAA
ncbi:MAG TPA: type IV toxin-antitoxin system AbiEi family antitoxin domain-containing protein [Acidimicrobiales bacterium]|nr:type IV toxin-antitoxin system AbiEi family antitoxin domain-containing protein [Acidimicrobiales bacterium]